jgi:hypothetical protein
MMSCWSWVDSIRKRSITRLASLPGLRWSSIASTRLVVRPSRYSSIRNHGVKTN